MKLPETSYFVKWWTTYDILMRLVVFKKKNPSPMGFFSNGIFQFRKPNKFLNAKNNNKGNNNYNFE